MVYDEFADLASAKWHSRLRANASTDALCTRLAALVDRNQRSKQHHFFAAARGERHILIDAPGANKLKSPGALRAREIEEFELAAQSPDDDCCRARSA